MNGVSFGKSKTSMNARNTTKKHTEKAGEDEPGFADTYFFKSNQLEELLERNGINVEKLVGLENVASLMEGGEPEKEPDLDISDEFKERLRKTAKMLRDDKAAPDLSNHILAIGWKK